MTLHGPSACPHPGPRACPRTVGHGCTLAHMATNICIYTHTHATVTGSSLIITQLYSSLSPAEYFTCDLARWQGGRGRGRGEGAGACAGQRQTRALPGAADPKAKAPEGPSLQNCDEPGVGIHTSQATAAFRTWIWRRGQVISKGPSASLQTHGHPSAPPSPRLCPGSQPTPPASLTLRRQ